MWRVESSRQNLDVDQKPDLASQEPAQQLRALLAGRLAGDDRRLIRRQMAQAFLRVGHCRGEHEHALLVGPIAATSAMIRAVSLSLPVNVCSDCLLIPLA